ncbi:MAG: class I SAM-dependent methyltransferase [Candidatus Didemnitutus sp.]|nr:class I SAM-dependent methyltransferase [Candidatus Didemnitutus sp.]
MGTKDFNALDLLICRWRSRALHRLVPADATMLDFGCGHQAMFLRSVQTKIKRGVGLDYDATPAQPAPNLELRQFRFVDRFDYPDASFNLVTILAVLEHIPLDQVDVLFREFSRILAPGGRILVTTPTPAAKPVLEFMAFRLKIISAPEIADHKHYYTEADLRALAARHGLSCPVYRRFLWGFNCLSAMEKPATPPAA